MPLYRGGFTFQHIAFCTVAALIDAIMVLLIYFALTLIYKNLFWIKEITIFRFLILIFVGGIGAIAAELRYLADGSWAYNKFMPIIPILNVGISPVLQFMLLPAFIYYFSYKITMPLIKGK